MKTRVVQLITFEVESGLEPVLIQSEDLADQICARAAKGLRFDVGDGLHAAVGTFVETVEAGRVMVTVADVSAKKLSKMTSQLSWASKEVQRLQTRVILLESWIQSKVAQESVEMEDELVNQVGTELIQERIEADAGADKREAAIMARLETDPEETKG